MAMLYTTYGSVEGLSIARNGELSKWVSSYDVRLSMAAIARNGELSKWANSYDARGNPTHRC
jgi:hypothetical protein